MYKTFFFQQNTVLLINILALPSIEITVLEAPKSTSILKVIHSTPVG